MASPHLVSIRGFGDLLASWYTVFPIVVIGALLLSRRSPQSSDHDAVDSQSSTTETEECATCGTQLSVRKMDKAGERLYCRPCYLKLRSIGKLRD